MLMPRYSVTDLGTLGGKDSSADAINDNAVVLGISDTATSDEDDPFARHTLLWENGQLRDITEEAKVSFLGRGLNDQGTIVGEIYPPDLEELFDLQGEATFLPAFYKKGQVYALPLAAASGGIAMAVNNKGQVVGTRLFPLSVPTISQGPPTAANEAYVWDNDKGRVLLVPTGYLFANPKAINDQGEILGSAKRMDLSLSPAPLSEAVLWKDGQTTLLGSLPGMTESEGVALNQHGQVLAKAIEGTVGHGFVQHGFLWSEGRREPLFSQEHTVSHGIDISKGDLARALNDSGEVVGEAYNLAGKDIAFLWRQGAVFDLNQCISDESSWILLNASGINNGGQIVGHGKHNGHAHAFLLTPEGRP